MEELELTTPITTVVSKYKVRVLTLDMITEAQLGAGPGLITILLWDENNQPFSHSYFGQEAIDFMKFMNTANFSVNSMHKRILQKLSNDGILPGTVIGTPDP